jgi:hypothetical protein
MMKQKRSSRLGEKAMGESLRFLSSLIVRTPVSKRWSPDNSDFKKEHAVTIAITA